MRLLVVYGRKRAMISLVEKPAMVAASARLLSVSAV